MVTRSLTTSIAGLVVAYFSVHLSMVPFGFGITSSTISLSSANRRKPPALPRSRSSALSCFPHFDPFGSTSARSSFISSTCHCVRLSRNVLRSRCQRTDLCFLLSLRYVIILRLRDHGFILRWHFMASIYSCGCSAFASRMPH